MYRYWINPEDLVGKDIIVVASGKVRAEYPYFRKHVRKMDPIQEIAVGKDERDLRTFYIRQLYDYQIPEK